MLLKLRLAGRFSSAGQSRVKDMVLTGYLGQKKKHAAGRERVPRPFPPANYLQRSKQADVNQGQHQSLQKESTADRVSGRNHDLVSLSSACSAVAMASQIYMVHSVYGVAFMRCTQPNHRSTIRIQDLPKS